MYKIEITEINSTENTNTGTFLQTPFWCEFKSRHGWSYRRFKINYKSENSYLEQPKSNDFFDKSEAEVSVLNRSFCKGMFSIAYIPLFPKIYTKNPLFDESIQEDENQVVTIKEDTDVTIEIANFLSDLSKELKKYLPKNTIAIRFDPDVGFDSPEERDDFNYGMKTVCFADKLKIKKNKVDIQPPDSTLVDLTPSEEEILGKMHAKWRYNIRLAAKKGVTVHRYLGNDEQIDSKIDKFYELTKETNARDGNSSHAKSYYSDLIKSSAKEISEGKDVPVISLYIAESEGEEIASIMTLFSKTESIYLYGASSNHKRNLMPNHLLQWTAMQDAKAYGSKIYDMYGMPPEGKDENHPMHGLYMFKANFGGKNIHRTGSWDIPLKPVYGLYNCAEKLRAFWHKKVLKKIRGR